MNFPFYSLFDIPRHVRVISQWNGTAFDTYPPLYGAKMSRVNVTSPSASQPFLGLRNPVDTKASQPTFLRRTVLFIQQVRQVRQHSIHIDDDSFTADRKYFAEIKSEQVTSPTRNS